MPRPQRMTAEEEKDLKFWLLFGIKEQACKNTTMLMNYANEGLNPTQIQYYINKFKLSFKYPFAFADDLVAYEVWYDEQEAEGSWIGDKTLIRVAIDDFNPDFSKEELSINNLVKEGRLKPESARDMIQKRLKVHMLHKAMIGEAKADPDIKIFGDTKAWQEWCKDQVAKLGINKQ